MPQHAGKHVWKELKKQQGKHEKKKWHKNLKGKRKEPKAENMCEVAVVQYCKFFGCVK